VLLCNLSRLLDNPSSIFNHQHISRIKIIQFKTATSKAQAFAKVDFMMFGIQAALNATFGPCFVYARLPVSNGQMNF